MTILRLAAMLAAIAPLPVSYAQNRGSPAYSVNKESRIITVSASDHAEADADIADIHIGFTAYGSTLKSAYKSASDTSSAVVKAMLDAGAKSAEIQSQNQSISRLSEPEIKEQRGARYSVQQSWTVSVGPKEAALVLDAAVQAGANQSGDINWRMKNSATLELEAIHKATERARALATEIASSLDVKLGKPIYASNSTSPIEVRPMMMDSLVPMAMKVRSAPAPLSIQPQRVGSDVTVQIVFAIE